MNVYILSLFSNNVNLKFYYCIILLLMLLLSKGGANMNEFEEKNIDIVSGNVNDLNISDVSEYLEVEKPKDDNNKGKIIIPDEKK